MSRQHLKWLEELLQKKDEDRTPAQMAKRDKERKEMAEPFADDFLQRRMPRGAEKLNRFGALRVLPQEIDWEGYEEELENDAGDLGFQLGKFSRGSGYDLDEQPVMAKPATARATKRAAKRAAKRATTRASTRATTRAAAAANTGTTNAGAASTSTKPATTTAAATTTSGTTTGRQPNATGRVPTPTSDDEFDVLVDVLEPFNPANTGTANTIPETTTGRHQPNATGRLPSPTDDDDLGNTDDELEAPAQEPSPSSPNHPASSPPFPSAPDKDGLPTPAVLINRGKTDSNNNNTSSPLGGPNPSKTSSGSDLYWTGYLAHASRRAGGGLGETPGLPPPEDTLQLSETSSETGDSTASDDSVRKLKRQAVEGVRRAVKEAELPPLQYDKDENVVRDPTRGQQRRTLGVKEVFNDRKEFYKALEGLSFWGVFDQREVEAIVRGWVNGLGRVEEDRKERERWGEEVGKVERVRGLRMSEEDRKYWEEREGSVKGRRKGVSRLFADGRVFGELGRQVATGHKWWGGLGRVPGRLIKEFRATGPGCRLQGLVWEGRLSVADWEIFLRRWLEWRFKRLMEDRNAAKRKRRLKERWERKERKRLEGERKGLRQGGQKSQGLWIATGKW